MKKVSLVLGMVFMVLTLVGAGYIFRNHGQVNAGYAVVPMLWCIIFFALYRNRK